ncbi:uncharacterized protein LY89DRAFT_718614 [Mollisia scopiformis]|uniref:Zn(2)-C6 fungal-type domain-containing protein n=1 Tax=Mollisia scopiformis TaxID=149040 RepID=A0A194X9P3_MOLSC|nr:uncharacterized protein LY89DRAFT_718614 [Mollisia scopiformis]KUJ16886.1 hypothetical protein LY89DRAFT_718614 [Mollisia scopiformis]
MPSPSDINVIPVGPRRKKKACRRCRHRKQRCDFQQPCHNCEAAGVECLPVIQEPQQNYPAGYVPALENHAAMLERTLNERFPALDHLGSGPPVTGDEVGQSYNYDYLAGTSPDTERIWQWQVPQTPNTPGRTGGSVQLRDLGTNQPSPPDFTAPRQTPIQAIQGLSTNSEQIPTATAASFFRTYFQAIHPQYPFLSVQDCGKWYNEWKLAPGGDSISGWPAFFVKMIFAIGSLIQSKSDAAPRYQHQDLKSQAQSEDAIIRSTKSDPLTRLQAMLLSAMHALHSESTARISHISGAIIRFASLHGFHQLVDLGDEDSQMKIKAWSCAYILDRAVSGTLDVPVSLADAYISSPLYVVRSEEPYPMPWLNDAPPPVTAQNVSNLGTFAHICKIRLIQSYIIHVMHSVPIEGDATREWQDSMRIQIENWADEIYSHSLMDNEGYQSPLWLGLIGQLSRILLCRPTRLNINTHVSDVAFQASCDACTTFRALQKKRQVAQPWLVVITQFQAGVTILYVIWARALANIPSQADSSIRDCTSVLAILADRWQNAEHYRDCFEVVARAVPRCSKPGYLDREAREELADLIEKVSEAGVHRHVRTMLCEMAALNEDEEMGI